MESPPSLNYVYFKLHNKQVTMNGTSYEIAVMAPPGTSAWYSSGSHHTVLFGRLKCLQSTHHWVVFKFSHQVAPQEVRPMTSGELESMMAQYTLLEKFCQEFEDYNPYNRIILVNKPLIRNIGGIDVWMEDYIPKFQKFWGTNASTKLERMVTSSSRALSLLQYFIHQQTGNNRTIIDLQGGLHKGKYILCDIEFSDTLSSTADLYNIWLKSSDFISSKSEGLLSVSSKNELSLAWYSQFDSPASMAVAIPAKEDR